MIRFRCPNCRSAMEVDESFAGRPARCPTCGADLRVPQSTPTAAPAVQETPRPGATVVRVGGETIEVLPPIETMALVSLGLVILAVVATVLIGLLGVLTLPWTVATTIGALAALLATVTGIPAYHTIRRSRGHKRGKALAGVSILAAAALFLGFGAAATAGWVKYLAMRPTCEENLRKIYAALRAYAKDHDGTLMPSSPEALVRGKYLDSTETLTCPAYWVRPGTPTYILYVGPAQAPPINLNDPIFPRDLMIASDGPRRDSTHVGHPDGFARILLLDGTVEKIAHDEWNAHVGKHQKMWSEILTAAARRQNKTSGGAGEGGS